MTGHELRKQFLEFFVQREHRIMPSASLVPSDPTTLFTVAGMQQFVPAFRGEAPIPAPRVATCQKCLRIDDLDRVGRTPGHETFFEMLGNFSFGEYFKREAIVWAWELVTGNFGLDPGRIWISIYPTDDEAFDIWRKDVGVPSERIVRLEDNWWPPGGGLGPCGPDSELVWDLGEESGCGRPDCGPACDCGRFVELWNLVFQQYNRERPTEPGASPEEPAPSPPGRTEGKLTPLPSQNIDTGMGFERTLTIIQGKKSIFETDIFRPIVSSVLGFSGLVDREEGEDAEGRAAEEARVAARIIADHARAICFLLADGVTPSNEGRGYVLRRLIRRAARFGRELGLAEPFLDRLVPVVDRTMGAAYPELARAGAMTQKYVQMEENRFADTLELGMARLEKFLDQARREDKRALPGEWVFQLYDTYGFPVEMAGEIARERGLAIDRAGFEQAMQQQRVLARTGAAEAFARQEWGAGDPASGQAGELAQMAARVQFVGYRSLKARARVLAIYRSGRRVQDAGDESPSAEAPTPQSPPGRLADDGAAADEVEIVLDRTPFYAEAGGQVGDAGLISSRRALVTVRGAVYRGENLPVHLGRIEKGRLCEGDAVVAQVDAARRQAIARAHSATHILHHALRKVLGDHATQQGSLVEPDRLRFDFSHFGPLTPEQVEEIETLVQQRIVEDHPVRWFYDDLASARAKGAMALFGEKYGEKVRVVKTGDFSLELCGGTHLSRTSAVGTCIITAQSSVGAGLRRVEALTGMAALKRIQQQERILDETARALRVGHAELVEKAQQLAEQVRRLQKELEQAQSSDVVSLSHKLAEGAVTCGHARVVAARAEGIAPKALRDLADRVLERLGSAVVVLATERGGKVAFVAEVSRDLAQQGLHAGNIVGQVARLTGGGGGGRADFAEAGGRDASKLAEALEAARRIVVQELGASGGQTGSHPASGQASKGAARPQAD
jgi:alanyl-tRNA synthetase